MTYILIHQPDTHPVKVLIKPTSGRRFEDLGSKGHIWYRFWNHASYQPSPFMVSLVWPGIPASSPLHHTAILANIPDQSKETRVVDI